MNLTVSVLVAFIALTLALGALWLAQPSAPPRVARAWTWAFALAVAAALYGGLVDVRAVVVLLFYAAACRAANRAGRLHLGVVAHVLLFAITATLMLHVAPGFNNPLLLDRVVLSPGGVPYTKFLNFDKGLVGLFLLGLYAPALLQEDRLHRAFSGFAWRFAAMLAVVIAASLASGFVAWDPKLPVWFPVWVWSMLFLTALPEEALFRGVVQHGLEPRLGRGGALAAGALVFGLAHAGGGPLYVVLAVVAGAGYGWIYLATRSISAAILAHAGLNTVHLLLFTYPALASRYQAG